MEKYATYRLFRNTETGEVKKVQPHEEVELEKVASDEWKEISDESEEP